jgi:uncharacterized protein (TIGR02246 family)
MGSGEKFSHQFTKDAHFVVFDGTVLEGADAIGKFHQQAFDTHLSETLLNIELNCHRQVGDDVLLVFTTGGIRSADGRPTSLSGESLQTMVLVKRDGQFQIDAFQNTRKRPITDGRAATVWKEFDAGWNRNVPGG